MKKLLLLLVVLIPLTLSAQSSEINKMAGRKVTIQLRYLDKTIVGDLKESTPEGIVIYVNVSERMFIFYDAIATIKEHK